MLALIFAAAVATQTPHIIISPDWLTKPSGADVAAFYPPSAAAAHLSGRAVIACNVDAEGALQDCSVADETPAGAGFGQAALAMATRFRMKPMNRDGVPVAGGRVRVPINFAAPPPPAAASAGGVVPPVPPADASVTADLPVAAGCNARLSQISRYPEAARRLNLTGSVLLNCDVSGRRPSDCQVVREQPPGAGFALAAVATAQCHMTVHDAVPGRRNIPVNFKPPGS